MEEGFVEQQGFEEGSRVLQMEEGPVEQQAGAFRGSRVFGRTAGLLEARWCCRLVRWLAFDITVPVSPAAAAAVSWLQLYTLPEPCTQDFLQQVATWQHTPESEDLEAERTQYYGTAGGSPFGARVSRRQQFRPGAHAGQLQVYLLACTYACVQAAGARGAHQAALTAGRCLLQLASICVLC